MRRFYLFILLLCLYGKGVGQTVDEILSYLPPTTRAERIHYWFDEDVGTLSELSQMEGAQAIDVSGLIDGMHTLHCQIEDNLGAVASPQSIVFLKFTKESMVGGVGQLQYWFDDNQTPTSVSSTSGIQLLDVSSLLDGLHTVHYQVVDENGKVTPPYSQVFLKFTKESMVGGVGQLQYWFDDNQTPTSVSSTSGIQLLDVSSLLDGLHTVHYQVVDENGKVTPPYSQVFMKIAQYSGELSLKSLLYWYDDETEVQTLPITSGVQVLDASSLLEGLHTLHYQVVCNDGSLTPAYSSIFLRMNKDQNSTAVKELRYWFDEETQANVVEAVSGVQVLDASALLEGLHTLHYQVVDEAGNAGSPCSSVFLKMDTEQSVAQRQRYWFDDDPKTLHEAPVTSGVQLLDIDGLLTGLHTLHYQLVDEQGRLSSPHSSVFIKLAENVLPGGENAITDYMYWTNDYAQDNVKVTLPQPASPYHFQALLPIIKAPIRSTSFQFEVTDGQPTVYAKNDIHVRFFDAAGYWADDSRSFIDYSVSEALDNIAELQTTQTFERPAENGIKWFVFEAQYGDSIALKSNQATSIQVFDATGKELYAASGSTSVNYGGCHLKADGTYYVAVHDVTGSGSQLTLQTQRIDKFAVFDFTPNKLASAGYTLMYFDGNGMDFVKKVELTNGDITLEADTLLASTQNLLARFHLQENYDNSKLFTLKVFFDKEDTGEQKTLTFDNAVVLEAVDNKPQMTVEITSERRVADPYPIKVVVKNEGNMPQYGIPLNVAFDNVEKFDDLAFVDFDLILSDELYESRDFFTYTDNLVGTGKKGYYMPLLIPYIGPYEERTFTFGVRTRIPHARFNFYAWTGDPWYDATMDIGVVSQAVARAPQARCEQSNIHRVYDLFGLIDNVASFLNLSLSPATPVRMAVGTGEAIAGVQQGLSRTVEDATFDAYGIDPSERDQYRFQYRYCVRCPRDIWEDASPLQAPARVASATINSTTGSSSWEPIDDYASSDCPKPDPHLVDVYIPGDPNEMTGYSAPSGSRHMSDEVKTIGYDIEFENDPEIANSAAHCIVIENQLDPTKFDLKTFTPKDITLSGKKVELNGSKSFVQTLDLRPEIDAIAELQCAYNVQTGLIRWTFTSLDPMSMEPTDDIMQGVLPVNYDGTSGIGNVTYTVDLLKTFPDGTEISNKASIIFDNNDAIETPVWTNTIDAVCPEGRVTGAVLTNDSTATIRCEGSDERSGVWKYEVYVQYGSGELWEKVGECPADSAEVSFRVYDGMDYGFCALAVDSAGNVEVKEMAREASLGTYLNGDANADGTVDIEDVVNAMRYFLGKTDVIYLKAADITGDGQIDIEDVVGIGRIFLTQPSTAAKSPIKRQRLRESLQL